MRGLMAVPFFVSHESIRSAFRLGEDQESLLVCPRQLSEGPARSAFAQNARIPEGKLEKDVFARSPLASWTCQDFDSGAHEARDVEVEPGKA